MQRCKYLDDLGISKTNYGTNFTEKHKMKKDKKLDKKREKRWKKQRKKYGFDDRETWVMDRMFVEWIYTRVKMYIDITCVDTDAQKIMHNEKEYTQTELMSQILELCKKALLTDQDELDENGECKLMNIEKEICDVWRDLVYYMSW